MSQIMVHQSKNKHFKTFEQQSTAVMHRLRASLSVLIGAVPSTEELRKATDLQKALGIGNTLAWQVYKLAHARDPLVEASSVPGAGGMKRLFEAAAQHGVPAKHIEDSVAAIKEFDELVKFHAGDRMAFDSMISGMTEEGAQLVDAQQKRAAFRANSHLWGLQARTQLKCTILNQSLDSTTNLDLAQLQGYVNLRRFRQAIPLLISDIQLIKDDEHKHNILPPYRRESLAGDGATTQGAPLLKKFCSQPPPEIRTIRSEAGDVQTELVACGVGNESAVTFMFGDVVRSVPGPYAGDAPPGLRSHAWVRVPAEVLIQDVLIHEDVFGSLTTKTTVFGDHNRSPASSTFDLSGASLLGTKESTVYMGKGPTALQTPDVPRYPDMAEYAFDRLGWDGEKFDVYRCRVEYPVMPSAVVMHFDLPEKP
ncbi:MAG: hypothetical protein IH984_13020 [Planctomycetes bacterium]|nr:hypothetical protein [Planctomycetota bacterium]